MKAYKLLKKRRDGSLGPLFINASQHIPIGKWLESEDHPTKGYAHRPGWHACMDLKAPHMKMGGRIWCEVELEDYRELKRPESQGTKWFIANRMKVVKELPDVVHENPFGKVSR